MTIRVVSGFKNLCVCVIMKYFMASLNGAT